MNGLNLNRDELVVLLYEVDMMLQDAIVKNVPERIEFYTNLSIKLHAHMGTISERGL
jgi:hypothetical protein